MPRSEQAAGADTGDSGGLQDKDHDNSLQGNALQRALGDKPPTTLTAFEWQEWYAEHGIPKEHRKSAAPGKGPWERLKAMFKGKG